MDGHTDDGQIVITIAHPEHSSGELKSVGINMYVYFKMSSAEKFYPPCPNITGNLNNPDPQKSLTHLIEYLTLKAPSKISSR